LSSNDIKIDSVRIFTRGKITKNIGATVKRDQFMISLQLNY